MTSVVILLLVVLLVLLVLGVGGPRVMRRRPGRRVIETVYEDDPRV